MKRKGAVVPNSSPLICSVFFEGTEERLGVKMAMGYIAEYGTL